PGEKKYYEAFLKQWEQIDTYVIDKEHGGWFINGLDHSPEAARAPKASIWKVNYHNGRALINCIKMLKDESEVVHHFAELAQH
ncbi:MAG: N-acylglucosamine 2-epimerase, partial [Bacteroidota bacterium]